MSKPTVLRAANMEAAKNITKILKRYKAITYKEFRDIWCRSRGWKNPWKNEYNDKSPGEYYGLAQNYDTTIAFLIEQGLMTQHRINGLRIFVATPLCYRGKLKMFDNE
jgi:hypothetical protein